jgi:hypothetical protein
VPSAAGYGLIVGLAGGQLVLFKALTLGPAYLISRSSRFHRPR